MVYIFDEGGLVHLQIPFVVLDGDEVKEEVVELVAERDGKVVSGPYSTVQEALYSALQRLAETISAVESSLDSLEFRLETEEKASPGEVYTALYNSHMLYFAASQLRQLAVELKRRGLVGYRQYAYARSLARRALLLRRFARDVRLLYSTVVQMSLNVSVTRLTWLGTVALPAVIITGFYGMNLSWLPLADNPLAVFIILAAATAGFAYILGKLF